MMKKNKKKHRYKKNIKNNKMLKKILTNKDFLLFFIGILSFIILPSTYSRFIEKEYGQPQGILAKWSIKDISNGDDEINLIAHNESEETYLFEITSTSEVASDYSVSLANVPNDISVVVDDNGAPLQANVNNKIFIDNLGGFEIDEQGTTNSHTFKFISNGDTLAEKADVDIEVLIKQRINDNGGT